MLSPINLLLITAILCAVMLLVLGSLRRSGIAGVKEWIWSNCMAFAALMLYALRGIAPDVLSIEVANALLAGSIASIYIGLRRFFQLDVPSRTLIAGLGVMVAGVAAFHYIWDLISARVVVVSMFHGAVSFCIGTTLLKTSRELRRRYAYRFTLYMAFLFAFGHLVRGLVYASNSDMLTSSLHATSWNLLFLSIGTLVLPIYTMGAVMMVHDRMMLKALDEANRDFLTSVWSRRAFFNIAERELLRSRRTGRPLSLLVFDVDHFKQLNDNFGHATGDQVLVGIAECATKTMRSIDYIARIGGEEFAVLLPDTDISSAIAIAERLRHSLNEHVHHSLPKSDSDLPFSVSVSIGVAMASRDEVLSMLLNRADKALYKAKASGRNAVSVAE
jgi:diguanylate cyclase (GGDEF)-like protein